MGLLYFAGVMIVGLVLAVLAEKFCGGK